jgi:hypothetical protein
MWLLGCRFAIVDSLELNRTFLRQMFEGLVLLLLACAIKVTLALLPEQAFKFRSPQRTVVLGVACAGWAFSCLGMWKLASRSINRTGTAEADQLVRILLRIGAVLLSITPAFLVVMIDYRHPLSLREYLWSYRWSDYQQIILVVIGGVSGACLLLRLRRLAQRLGTAFIAALAGVTACLWPAVWVMLLVGSRLLSDDEQSSLDLILGLPLPPAGAIELIRAVLRNGLRGGRWGFVLFLLTIPIASIFMLFVITPRTWRALRQQREDSRARDATTVA